MGKAKVGGRPGKGWGNLEISGAWRNNESKESEFFPDSGLKNGTRLSVCLLAFVFVFALPFLLSLLSLETDIAFADTYQYAATLPSGWDGNSNFYYPYGVAVDSSGERRREPRCRPGAVDRVLDIPRSGG